ncbi:MAG: CBS domain-containing protein [Balneolaceae bacterium]|nr:CBS domain-containing protein [Balneolaceae bacterium]
MQAEHLLNTRITPLSGQETVAVALERLQELDAHCLPMVDQTTDKLIGQIHRKQLLREEQPETPVSDLELEEPVKVFGNQHIFEAARLMFQYEIDILPVVDPEISYRGAILKQELLETLPEMLNLVSNGSILTIQLDQVDFSLSEMVHLIEVEGAKILGLVVESPEQEGGEFTVSVKVNLRDASRVVSSLRRHDYTVIADDTSRDVFGFDMENRADELIKYIDM